MKIETSQYGTVPASQADPNSPPDALPHVRELGRISSQDARALSKIMFARLASLEEGTPAYQYVRNSLVELNLALVRFALRRFRGRAEPVEDLMQVGTIGLIKAINRFDPERGTEFPTFALPTIRGEIMRFLRDTSWGVSVPRRLQELRLRLAKAGDELDQSLGRAPTTAELAAHLDLSEKEVVEGLAASNGYTTRSIDAAGAVAESGGTPLADRLACVDPGLEKVEDFESLKPLIARLPQRQRTILAMRFSEELTQSEIGARLGLSQMYVSRLLRQTLSDLRTRMLTDA